MQQSTEPILFIVNPVSGVRDKAGLPSLIETCLSDKNLPYRIEYTDYPGHASELAKEAKANGYKYVVAAGGDGTINEVASELIGSSTALGIIPFGSGNGLARHLKIPLKARRAIENISSLRVQCIDTCKFNDSPFFCTAGLGFDAIVSHEFAKKERRGFWTYILTSLRQLKKYQPKIYNIRTNDHEIETEAFSITFANAAQFGNNAYISPKSSIIDGQLELCIIKPFPKWLFFILAFRLFTKLLISTKYTRYVSCKHITISLKNKELAHIDGEPMDGVNQVQVNILPESLRIIHSKDIRF